MKLSRLPAGPGRPEEQYRWTPSPTARAASPAEHQRLQPVVGVPHDPTLPHPAAPQFELRLHQREQVEARRGAGDHRGQHLGEGDEREVHHDQVGPVLQGRGVQPPGVHPFHHDHAAILTQPPVELSVADVHAGHPGRPVLQQAVREPAGGGPQVQRAPALDLDVEALERPLELQPPRET